MKPGEVSELMNDLADEIRAEERARCVQELRDLAARYRALPAKLRAQGKKVNLGQEWSCDVQASGLKYAADLLEAKGIDHD